MRRAGTAPAHNADGPPPCNRLFCDRAVQGDELQEEAILTDISQLVDLRNGTRPDDVQSRGRLPAGPADFAGH
jgi:hypothetical protein